MCGWVSSGGSHGRGLRRCKGLLDRLPQLLQVLLRGRVVLCHVLCHFLHDLRHGLRELLVVTLHPFQGMLHVTDTVVVITHPLPHGFEHFLLLVDDLPHLLDGIHELTQLLHHGGRIHGTTLRGSSWLWSWSGLLRGSCLLRRTLLWLRLSLLRACVETLLQHAECRS